MLKNKTRVICVSIWTMILGFALYAAAFANEGRYHDPTRPLLSNPKAQGDSNPYGFKIDSIIISKDRKLVSINGQHLKIGDKLDEVTIVDIYPNGVRLKDNFGEFTVNMPYYNIKNAVDDVK